jgi:rRNA-processing protein FCF1
MCIIADANVLGDLNTPSEDGEPVMNWLLKGRGALIIGGYLKRELERSRKLCATLVVLDQAGRLHRLNDEKVKGVAEKIEKGCCSDDSHVVAAAIISGCRLVFTKDQALHKDLKNKDIINPSASIYQSKSHKHLLTDCDCKV